MKRIFILLIQNFIIVFRKINYNDMTIKVNEEYDLGAGFDDALKADNHILLTVSTANRMIG